MPNTHAVPPTPIEHSFWVAPGKLLGGHYPGSKIDAEARAKITALSGAGIEVYIDLTEPFALRPYRHLLADWHRHQRLAIRDMSVPKSRRMMADILDTIDDHLHRGRRVYVHCWGGHGRTGLVLGCWLARHRRSGEAGLRELNELWKQSAKYRNRYHHGHLKTPETLEQRDYIRSWHEK